MTDVYKRTSIFQWNANGLRTKSGDFRQFVAQFCFPILAISEARVDSSFRLANYVLYKSTRPGGPSRCLLGIRKDLVSTLLFSSTSDVPEYVACQVRVGRMTLTVVSIYIEPQISMTSAEFNSFFKRLTAPYVMCGDFNAHHTLWGSSHCDQRGNLIENIID